MRTKELKPGMKVWHGNRNELQRGLGSKVTVVEIAKNLTRTRQPCGVVIVRASGDVSYEPQVLVKFAQEDKHELCYYESEHSNAQYKLLLGGRSLMSEAEHKVMRSAREALQLEHDAHVERGKELSRVALDLARKALHDAGLPDGVVEPYLMRRWPGRASASERETVVTVRVDEDVLRKLIGSRELTAALKEYSVWAEMPVPGKDCAL